jgi:hypothetical protein
MSVASGSGRTLVGISESIPSEFRPATLFGHYPDNVPDARLQKQIPQFPGAFFGINQRHIPLDAKEPFGNFDRILEISYEINQTQIFGAGT